MTSANTSEDVHQGRGWLNRAAEMLDSCEDHVSDAEFARAAAAIGNGFIQLAAVERATAWRAEDLARWTADREAERENNEVVREVNLLALTRERGELALVEQRTEVLAALDVAGLAASGRREKRAAAEALPHDDEPPTIVHVVAEDDGCVLHVASTAGKAEQWLMSTAGNREARDALSITELAVDRG